MGSLPITADQYSKTMLEIQGVKLDGLTNLYD